jgi:hypothetical protein
MLIRLRRNCFASEWKSFVDENSKAMFQTALVLSLNPMQAEDALITSAVDFDLSRPPCGGDRLIWERAVVKLSVGIPQWLSTNECASLARPLVQPGLRPLTQIDHLPRMSFVLRLLLRYSTEACAQILDIDKSEIPSLVTEAAIQLSRRVPPYFPNGDAA